MSPDDHTASPAGSRERRPTSTARSDTISSRQQISAYAHGRALHVSNPSISTTWNHWRFQLPYVQDIKRSKVNVASLSTRASLDRFVHVTAKAPGHRSLSEVADTTALLSSIVPFVASQDLSIQRKVASCCWLIRKSQGGTICRQSEHGDCFFLNVHGSLRVFVWDTDEQHNRQVTTLSRGAAFGELALLSNQPRSTTVTAKTDAVLVAIDKDDFLQVFYSQYSQLGQEVSQFFRKYIRSLADVPRDALSRILSSARMESLSAGEVLNPDSMHRILLVRNGHLSFYRSKSAGGNHIANLTQGELIGASALFPELRKGFSIKVTTVVVECFSIPVDILKKTLPTSVQQAVFSEVSFRQEYLERRTARRTNEVNYTPAADVDPQESTSTAASQISGVESRRDVVKPHNPYEHHLLRELHKLPSSLLQKLRKGTSSEELQREGPPKSSEVMEPVKPALKESADAGLLTSATDSLQRLRE